MADDRVRQMTQTALNRLSAELKAGKSQGLEKLFDTMSRFPTYSWSNDLLVSQQRPTATRLGTMHKWQTLGRSVREGEKPITIVAPVFKRDQDRAQTPPMPGQTAQEDGPSRLVGFRPAYVYDVKQTHGESLPGVTQTRTDPRNLLDKLKEFAAKQEMSFQNDKTPVSAERKSHEETIKLIPVIHPAEEFSALVREVARQMAEDKRAGQLLPQELVEAQAEAVSYVVCRGVGLETNSAAADYIHLYNGDKKTLAESLSVIQETSSKILDHLLPEQNRSPFQDKPGRSFTEREPDRAHQAGSMPAGQAPVRDASVSLER